jgi:hypothetical protein
MKIQSKFDKIKYIILNVSKIIWDIVKNILYFLNRPKIGI